MNFRNWRYNRLRNSLQKRNSYSVAMVVCFQHLLMIIARLNVLLWNICSVSKILTNNWNLFFLLKLNLKISIQFFILEKLFFICLNRKYSLLVMGVYLRVEVSNDFDLRLRICPFVVLAVIISNFHIKQTSFIRSVL